MSDSDQETRLPEDAETSSAEALEETTISEAASPEANTPADVKTSADETPADLETTPDDSVADDGAADGTAEAAPAEEAVEAPVAEVAAAEAETVEATSTETKAEGEVENSQPSEAAAVAEEPTAEDGEVPAGAVAAAVVETQTDETQSDETSEQSDQASAPTEAAEAADAKPKKKAKRKRKKKAKKPAAPVEDSEELIALRRARDEKIALQGRVFGWNDGGFHIAIGEIPAFCPRSEISAKQSIGDPAAYIDQLLPFRVLKVQENGKRIVVSHAVIVREIQNERRKETMKGLEAGATVTGKVSSLTDFGAFVDLGGVEGLVHISEISRQRVANPADVLELGQEVEVKVLKIEKSGRRISLSIKELLPDPWRDIKERFEEGSIVTGRVERTGKPGAFIELEPGLTGLLPTSEMNLPREAIPARSYPPGREVKVMIAQVDTRRRRIALVPEGAAVGGSRTDYMKYRKEQQAEAGEGFNAMAAALSKLKK